MTQTGIGAKFYKLLEHKAKEENQIKNFLKQTNKNMNGRLVKQNIIHIYIGQTVTASAKRLYRNNNGGIGTIDMVPDKSP